MGNRNKSTNLHCVATRLNVVNKFKRGQRLSALLHNPFLRMDLDFEVLRDKRIHAIVDHEYRAINRIVNGKVQHCAEEIVLLAKLFHPALEFFGPFALVFFEVITTFEQERQLVITVMPETEKSGKVQVKLVQVAEVVPLVSANLFRHLVHNAKRIVLHQVFHFHIIDQILKERLLKR
jgi:hypothetical protein